MRLSGKNGGDKNEKNNSSPDATNLSSRDKTQTRFAVKKFNFRDAQGTATEAEGKANKLMENSFILFASFSVSHAFGNLLHFQCVCSPVLGTAFFAVTKRDRDNIFILFCAVR